MNYQSYTFFIEQLANGAWIVGWREGTNDYGRIPDDRSGFPTYEEAEKYAVSLLRKQFRKKRDEWTNQARLNKALSEKRAA